jgi:ParB family chromosome partitioning protein
MTIIDTPTTDIQTIEAEAAQDEARVVAEVRHIDPQTLVVEDNIRSQVNIDRKFVASIRQHGVIVPILAHPDADGNVVVRDGQRRTLAAREAEVATVPVYVVDAADEKRIRIIQQYITNEHRDQLTDADRAEAWRQLALDGMSVTAIAKQTGAKRDQIKTGLAVAGHDIAKQAVTEHELTLDQALVLIDFEDDPDALTALRDTAKRNPDGFDHHAQRLLDDKATKEEIAALTADYEAQGYTVVAWPSWDDTDTLFLRDLTDAEGERLTEENYTGKPGHAVAIGERWGSVSVGHVVVDWKAHGLRKISSTGSLRGGKMTEDEKAERRRVVANNKAWDSAEKVRRAWLTKFLGRKRLPGDAAAFAAITLTTATFEVGRAVQDHHTLACELISTEYRYGGVHPLAAQVIAAPTKAAHVTLAVALAALEGATSRATWRDPGKGARRYFQQLAAWGYTLSEVEQIVIGTNAAEDTDAAEDTEDAPTEDATEAEDVAESVEDAASDDTAEDSTTEDENEAEGESVETPDDASPEHADDEATGDDSEFNAEAA